DIPDSDVLQVEAPGEHLRVRPLAAALNAHDDVFAHAATFARNRAAGDGPRSDAAPRGDVALRDTGTAPACRQGAAVAGISQGGQVPAPGRLPAARGPGGSPGRLGEGRPCWRAAERFISVRR